jgi:type IV pilus assembly protein PilB
METPRVRLGELLVRAGLISGTQLDEALAEQRKNGKRLGSLLVELGLVSETQVTQILSQQLSVPWVSLHHIDFSRQLLNLVPIDIVERYCLIPIYVRRVRGLGDALYVAMDDPTNAHALDEVASRAGLHVRPMIAPPSDIRSAIRVYYGVGEAPPVPAAQPITPMSDAEHDDAPTGIHARAQSAPSNPVPDPAESPQLDAAVDDLLAQSSPSSDLRPSNRPSAPAVIEPPMESSITASSGAVAAPADAVGSVPKDAAAGARSARSTRTAVSPDRAPRSSPVSSSGEALPPSSRSGAGFASNRPSGDRAEVSNKPRKKMISLTLLDGTTISLPGKGKGKGKAKAASTPEPEDDAPPQQHEDQLTARDLVAALRAASHGADASEILGENVRWEAMFSALLSLLLKKHLIADWEFVDEFKKG